MRIRVVFLGADARDPLQVAAADFLARAGRRFDAGLVPLPAARRGKGSDTPANDEKVKELEAVALLKASEGTTRVALAPDGVQHASSRAFAAALERWLERGKPVSFLIGGASGLAARVVEASDSCVSLSALTLAHRLAVCVLAEQIYRAHEIGRNGPYAR